MDGAVNTLIQILLALLAIFLILLILVQRGRGGGLAGVLGGSGGSSAFGAKAGDVFTRITMVTAAIWIILCAGALAKFGHNPDGLDVTADPRVPAGQGGAVSAPPSIDETAEGEPASDDSSAPKPGDDS